MFFKVILNIPYTPLQVHSVANEILKNSEIQPDILDNHFRKRQQAFKPRSRNRIVCNLGSIKHMNNSKIGDTFLYLSCLSLVNSITLLNVIQVPSNPIVIRGYATNRG